MKNIAVVLLFILTACSSRIPPTPAPVDSITEVGLSNGGSLTITTYQTGAWSVREQGLASKGLPVTKTHADLLHAGRIVDLIKLATPETKVSEAVQGLQERLNVTKRTDFQPPRIPDAPLSSSGQQMFLDSPQCGNPCCDQNYVDQLCSQDTWGQAGWNNFDFGYSNADARTIHEWNSVTCSAQGQSDLQVWAKGAPSGHYPVPEAWYNTYYWKGDGVCNGQEFCQAIDFATSVNSEYNQHLHSYCGGASWY